MKTKEEEEHVDREDNKDDTGRVFAGFEDGYIIRRTDTTKLNSRGREEELVSSLDETRLSRKVKSLQETLAKLRLKKQKRHKAMEEACIAFRVKPHETRKCSQTERVETLEEMLARFKAKKAARMKAITGHIDYESFGFEKRQTHNDFSRANLLQSEPVEEEKRSGVRKDKDSKTKHLDAASKKARIQETRKNDNDNAELYSNRLTAENLQKHTTTASKKRVKSLEQKLAELKSKKARGMKARKDMFNSTDKSSSK